MSSAELVSPSPFGRMGTSVKIPKHPKGITDKDTSSIYKLRDWTKVGLDSKDCKEDSSYYKLRDWAKIKF